MRLPTQDLTYFCRCFRQTVFALWVQLQQFLYRIGPGSWTVLHQTNYVMSLSFPGSRIMFAVLFEMQC